MHWLRFFTTPIALIYALVVYLRNFLYDIGFFESKSFSTPTICVGNLSLGGTGKTPMIDFLLRNLKSEYKIAVLSRGYKRKSKGFQLANEASDVTILGDEPHQLYSNHPEVTLAVDSNRSNGISKLEALDDFDFILLDDAFQHRKVKATLNILLTTFENPYPKDFYFPVGSLRDSKNQSKRADIILVTKCPPSLSDEDITKMQNLIRANLNQEILFTSLKYEEEFTNRTVQLTFEQLWDKKLVLVTGIAKPEHLVAYLKSKKLKFKHLKFSDHYFFSENDIRAFSKFDIVLTTEKDFARLDGKLDNLFYLGVSHEFFGDGKKVLLEKIKDLIKPD